MHIHSCLHSIVTCEKQCAFFLRSLQNTFYYGELTPIHTIRSLAHYFFFFFNPLPGGVGADGRRGLPGEHLEARPPLRVLPQGPRGQRKTREGCFSFGLCRVYFHIYERMHMIIPALVIFAQQKSPPPPPSSSPSSSFLPQVATSMGYSDSADSGLALVSFHSISKGFIGECGLRGGYFELFPR